ncbi:MULTISPECIES: hypothetical protein [Cryobacterium]|uniref:Nucleotidyltransferase family protein n=1 Tax=Cryobacterium breve TaxID=1259258 RepID=A0ABY2J7Y3_9MICO|nr:MULTISPECIES: hypothetical protein [Cryobacterium]TFC91259.1 hypothetical protein E3T20_14670 [Cryobacterium sp. TmT3-12]TFD01047.1 hypothetical protein E3O65_01745 [Cryobacterium breve]
MPVLDQRSSLAWHALFDLSEKVPNNWCLVGGQMVHLWCVERDNTPNQPTDDADAVLDVRAQPTILHQATKALVDIGFASAGESPEGHQHRWSRGDATIDLLIARARRREGRSTTRSHGCDGWEVAASLGRPYSRPRSATTSVAPWSAKSMSLPVTRSFWVMTGESRRTVVE